MSRSYYAVYRINNVQTNDEKKKSVTHIVLFMSFVKQNSIRTQSLSIPSGILVSHGFDRNTRDQLFIIETP